MNRMSIPVYLLECHIWSDGEENHEEDHNSYYDIMFFYLMDLNEYKYIYSWRADSHISSGLVLEATDFNIIGADEEKIYKYSIELDEAKDHIRSYLNKTPIRDLKILDATHIFLMS